MDTNAAMNLKTGELIWNNQTGDLLRIQGGFQNNNATKATVLFSVSPDKTERELTVTELVESYDTLAELFTTLPPASRAAFGLLMVDVNSIKMALVQAFSDQKGAQVQRQSPGGIIY